jgi:hypothetical protein
MKKIIIKFLIFFSVFNFLNGYDIKSNLDFVKNEILNKKYSLENKKEFNGIYFRYTDKMWFFYSTQYDYLLIHETGKEKVSEGAKQYINASKYFDSLEVKNLCVIFGNNTSGNSELNVLSNKKFCLNNTTVSALYEKFDTENNLWFAYFPKFDYMLIHETGKNKVSDGAYQIANVSSFLGKIILDSKNNNVLIGTIAENNTTTESNSTIETPPSVPNIDINNTTSENNESGLLLPPSVPNVN